jgi:uncharacterized cupredoxin-like copper-binding protein
MVKRRWPMGLKKRVQKKRVRTVTAVVASVFLAATACSSGADSSTDAIEKDFSITLGTDTLAAGDVTFHITNEGPSTHEFVVFKTDLAEDELPTTTDEDGKDIVDEEGEGVEAVDEVEDIEAGSDHDFEVNLTPASYVVICNLPEHYGAGMHASFTVED